MSNLNKILTNKLNCKSVWFMRQAGRYLPEFRKIRSNNRNFIQLCLNSELSSEITLQPVKRFDVDSAIIFSDILMVPFALGQKIEFIEGQGPRLSKLNQKKTLSVSKQVFSKKLDPVYNAIDITRKKLNKEKSLIAFIGAPWTLLVYMFGLRDNNKNTNTKTFYSAKKSINEILDKLIEFLCVHIENQINAGADVIQIFDSWAGILPENEINYFCYEPNLKLVNFCKQKGIPNICFPKGIKKKFKDFNNRVKPDGINIDSEINPSWAKDNLKDVVLQGGLEPKLLLSNEREMLEAASKYIHTFKEIPYVFNLGHGLLPETDPDRVGKLIKFYRNFNG